MTDRFKSVCATLLIVGAAIVPLVSGSIAVAQEQEGLPGRRVGRGAGGDLIVETAPDGRPMRAGSLIVKFRAGSDPAARDAAHAAVGALMVEPLLLPDTVRAQVPPSTTAPALDAYRSAPVVEYAEPDYVSRLGAP